MPTPKQEYIRSLREIARRYNAMEAETIRRAIELLQGLRASIQLELTAVEGWNAFRISELTAAIDRLVMQYEAQLLAIMHRTVRDSARLGALSVVEPIQAAGLTAGFFQPTPAQINVLLDFSADLIKGITAETRQMINREIRMAALGERSPIRAMQAVNERLGVPSGRGTLTGGIAYKGERIIRTEVGRVFNLANHSQQLVTAQSVPGLAKQWLSARIPKRTRPAHWAAHGQIVPVDQPFIVWKEELMFPGDPAASAENTINCLLPGNEVIAADVIAASRAWYSGPVFELTVASGKNITITPNHPVLTPAGFVPAKFLDEGDYVVSTSRGQEIASAINPDDDYIPTAIEEIWSSLFVVGERGQISSPAMPHYFHSDGRFMNGDIDIVFEDSQLRSDINNPPLPEHINELSLGWRLILQSFLSSFGFSDEFLLGNLSPPDGIVGGLSKSESFLGRQIRHSNLGVFASTPGGNPGFNQVSAKGGSGHSSLFSETLFSLAAKIAVQKMVKVGDFYSARGSYLDTMLNKNALNWSDGDAVMLGDILDTFTRFIHPDEIVRIRKFDFSNHVYDLQTMSQLYLSNGIFVHNCLCRTVTVHPEIGPINVLLEKRVTV